MRVVFMGTPEFAVPSLEALARHHELAAVLTRQDAVSGRGARTRPSAVKAHAEKLSLPVWQPSTLRDAEVQERLSELAPEVIVVAAYGLILPPEVLSIPVHGCINVHGSLLPRWRGAAPVQRAILAGDEETGVAIMQMEAGLDTGPFCLTGSTQIADKNATDLTAELAQMGATLLIEALDLVAEGRCEWTEQDDSSATYADKITKAEVALSPDLPTEGLLRRVRASSPQAPARARVGGRGVTVLRAEPSDTPLQPGETACDKHSLLLGGADGTVSVTELKPDGKGAMAGCDWARGARLESATWEADR